MADEQRWHEVRIVLRTSRERIDQAVAWLEDMGLAEVNRIDVIELDEDLRRWDGGRPPGVVAGDARTLLGTPEPTAHPVFDQLRRGIHLHEQ